MRRNDVASTSFRRRVPTRFFNKSVPNNYISHLKIRYYRKIKDRTETNSFASTGGWIIGGGGAKGMLAPSPPLKLLGGTCPPPVPTPMVRLKYPSEPVLECHSEVVVVVLRPR